MSDETPHDYRKMERVAGARDLEEADEKIRLALMAEPDWILVEDFGDGEAWVAVTRSLLRASRAEFAERVEGGVLVTLRT